MRHQPNPAPRRQAVLRAALAASLALAALSSVSTAAEHSIRPADSPVLILRPAIEDAARPAWAPRGDWIAYDKLDDLGYSKLYVSRPDGSERRCLTCRPLEFRQHHTGNAAWHPSGEYLVFQVEKPHKRAGAPLPFMLVPGGSKGDDLWAITFDGSSFWNLTNRAERGGRVTSPSFSREGDRLAWAERLATGAGVWGEWTLNVARFEIQRGVPRTRKVKGFRPGEQRCYYESGTFSADDKSIAFAANPYAGQPEHGLDLFSIHTESKELTRLTATPDEWDRYPRVSPNGRYVVWASGRDLDRRGRPFERNEISVGMASDLWMMDATGGGAVRLTRFNDVHSSEYVGKIAVGPAAWSPDGDKILVPAAPVASPEASNLYLLELKQPLGR